MRVLVVNAGSSSLKLSLLDGEEVLEARELPAPQATVDQVQLSALVQELPEPDAVGHRIVHGGRRFIRAVRLDAEVVRELHGLCDLAPLHQPKSLAALEAVTEALPGIPAVACFDTAFHSTLPAAAATYALPREWRECLAIHRYGFHGLSHAYASGRAAQLLGRPAGDLRMVTCHLGAGASLAAVQGGRSVDTTMGFTPLEGLVMATRSGSVDPGLLLWMIEHEGLAASELADVLEHHSGLEGLAGSSDMREILERSDADARLALEVYLHRLRAGIAAMTAALGGIDALVFTGGVGERSAVVRARAAAGLAFLGVVVEDERNRALEGDGEISASGAPVRCLVVQAREDLQIARETRGVLAGPA